MASDPITNQSFLYQDRSSEIFNGLNVLKRTEQIFIKQKLRLGDGNQTNHITLNKFRLFFVKNRTYTFENFLYAVCGCEMKNQYKIFDQSGSHIFNVTEYSTCFQRACLGPNRACHLYVSDATEESGDIIHFEKEGIGCNFPQLCLHVINDKLNANYA